MSCEPDGSARSLFSSAYSSRTSSAARPVGQHAIPQLHGDLARAGGHAGAVHEADGRLNATTTIEPGGVGIELARQTADRSTRRPRPCGRGCGR